VFIGGLYSGLLLWFQFSFPFHSLVPPSFDGSRLPWSSNPIYLCFSVSSFLWGLWVCRLFFLFVAYPMTFSNGELLPLFLLSFIFIFVIIHIYYYYYYYYPILIYYYHAGAIAQITSSSCNVSINWFEFHPWTRIRTVSNTQADHDRTKTQYDETNKMLNVLMKYNWLYVKTYTEGWNYVNKIR